jgi:hypothetical protein
MFLLHQFGELLRNTFETHAAIVQTQCQENLTADFEAQVIAPLQVFGCLREG